jgi:hypothetical protein
VRLWHWARFLIAHTHTRKNLRTWAIVSLTNIKYGIERRPSSQYTACFCFGYLLWIFQYRESIPTQCIHPLAFYEALMYEANHLNNKIRKIYLLVFIFFWAYLYQEVLYLLWGLSNMPKIWVYDIMTMRLVYPLSEHVDIFPVRLCLHSHWVHSVYLTLTIYLM